MRQEPSTKEDYRWENDTQLKWLEGLRWISIIEQGEEQTKTELYPTV